MLSLVLYLGVAALPALAQDLQVPILAQDVQVPSFAQSVHDWDKLNLTVGGRLFAGIPWAEPCFSSFNGKPVTPDSARCAFVQQNFFDSHCMFSNLASTCCL